MSEDIRVQVGDLLQRRNGEWYTVEVSDTYYIGLTPFRACDENEFQRFARPCNIEDAVDCIRCGQEMLILENPKIKYIQSLRTSKNRESQPPAVVIEFIEDMALCISEEMFLQLFAPMKLRFIPAVSE